MSKLTDALTAWGIIKNETHRNANTHTRIGDAGLAILDEVQERVSVNEQTLTDPQKAQARLNIGAGVPVDISEKADLFEGKVPLSQLPETGGGDSSFTTTFIDSFLTEDSGEPIFDDDYNLIVTI